MTRRRGRQHLKGARRPTTEPPPIEKEPTQLMNIQDPNNATNNAAAAPAQPAADAVVPYPPAAPAAQPVQAPVPPDSASAAAALPEPTLDLDAMEQPNPKPPFVFLHDGKRYMLSDPRTMDWQKLILALGNPQFFIRLALPPDNHNQFFTTPMPAWKMNALMERYQDHYEIPRINPAAVGAL